MCALEGNAAAGGGVYGGGAGIQSELGIRCRSIAVAAIDFKD